MLEALAGLLEVLGGKRRHREAFELRAVLAPPGSAAHRDDYSHCWALLNGNATKGARDVTFAWRCGPGGTPGELTELGTLPLMRTVLLDGITRPSERPAVSGLVGWTEIDGTRRRMSVSLD